MVPKIAISFALAIAVIGLAAFFILGGTQGTKSGAYVNSTGGSASNSSAILFASTQYAPFAYLISSATLSAQAQAALSGFTLSRSSSQNGTDTITLTYLGDGSKQAIVLRPKYSLYFIETSFGDDGFGSESSLGDDGIVLVDPNGYVAQ
ncbi:MAG: hypothetical protein KGH54_02190 [Candidatus Micrarchaeota archaeon]|nr:hypothetical protein [Candidatus Micrarchaeota archaeon]